MLFKLLSILTFVYFAGIVFFSLILIRKILEKTNKVNILNYLQLVVLWPITLTIEESKNELFFKKGK